MTAWLVQAIELANKRPTLWLGCVVVLALILAIGRISLALGLLSSVSSLFIAVGIVDYIDNDEAVSLSAVIRRHLPLALTLAIMITSCWFVFRVVANIYSGEFFKILQFFFYWEFLTENLHGKTFSELVVWAYSSAIVALIFVYLMLSSFGSWFSYPLMAFQQCSWSEARDKGRKAFQENAGTMYKLTTFLLLMALIGLGLFPILTPLCYMVFATLMYVSYRDLFVKNK